MSPLPPFPRMLVAAALVSLALASAFAQSAGPAASGGSGPMAAGPVELPVTKVVLYSSGVGYFEHRGIVSGDATVALSFRSDEVNDALKSLVVWDFGAASGAAPGSGGLAESPSVSYPSQESLDRALKGFRIDLSGSPRIADMLARLRGAELAVDAPDTIKGRIVSVESRPGGKDGSVMLPWLVLATKDGIRAISIDRIAAFRFLDPKLSEDFDRALSLILSTEDSLRRVLKVHLPGSGPRQAVLGYVVAAPVWKVSYRLDLSGDKSFLQAWAIVDNPTDQDWKDVSLSLVSGRPVSFRQDLYAPLYLNRPLLPLAIAGAAQARSFESGLPEEARAEADEASGVPAPAAMMRGAAKSFAAPLAEAAAPAPSLSQGAAQAASGRAAGDLFEFTLRGAVTLDRRHSAMLPLVAGAIDGRKVSVFTPGSGPGGSDPLHPMLGALLENDTGMKLPAGPITVFDGGIYAGDALLDFLPERDKRLIVFGDDLSVDAEVSASSSRETLGVTVAKGVMTFARRVTWTRSYTFDNTSTAAKTIVVEHPITPGTTLASPSAYDEKTPEFYRFSLALPASGSSSLVVKESSPEEERITLATLDPESFLAYASSKGVPESVRTALRKAVELKNRADDADRALADLQSRKTEIDADEARIRENIQAVGRDSSQGQQYMKKLSDSETELDKLGGRIEAARAAAQNARDAYAAYLGALDLK